MQPPGPPGANCACIVHRNPAVLTDATSPRLDCCAPRRETPHGLAPLDLLSVRHLHACKCRGHYRRMEAPKHHDMSHYRSYKLGFFAKALQTGRCGVHDMKRNRRGRLKQRESPYGNAGLRERTLTSGPLCRFSQSRYLLLDCRDLLAR